MDVITAASTLRSQLVALQNSDTQVSQLEKEITSLGQQSLMSVIEENQSHHLRLLLRVSVTDGVRDMYKQYSDRKWAEVQNTARKIKTSLEADGSGQILSVMTSSPQGGSTSQDKTAALWTSVFCEHSRSD